MRYRVKIVGSPAEIHEIASRQLVPPYMWNTARRYEDETLGYLLEINDTAPGQIGRYSVQPHTDPRKPVTVVTARQVMGRQ